MSIPYGFQSEPWLWIEENALHLLCEQSHWFEKYVMIRGKKDKNID